jgi:hypothetical protein
MASPEAAAATPQTGAAPQAAAPQPRAMGPAPRRSSAAMPSWLLTFVFLFALIGVGACVFAGINFYKGRNSGGGPAPATIDAPQNKAGGKQHPLMKYLEVAGVRFVGDKKGVQAKVLLVNHSEAEIANLSANVTIWGRTQRSEEDAVGTMTLQVPTLGANESKEIVATLNTKLKIYELPDWQNVTTDMQITSPVMQ